MGKVDDMRAMREARYSQRAKRIEGLMEKVTQPKPFHEERADRGLPPIETATCPDHPEYALVEGGTCPHCPEELCGHQSISKSRCTRPKDHPEKNHRYK